MFSLRDLRRPGEEPEDSSTADTPDDDMLADAPNPPMGPPHGPISAPRPIRRSPYGDWMDRERRR